MAYSSGTRIPMGNINKLEIFQRRAARFVKGGYNRTSSVTSMLADLNWNTLQERRLQSTTVIFDQLVVIPTTPHLIPARTPSGHNIQVLLPQSTVNIHIYLLFPCTMRIWNQLPPEVISSTSLEMFKQRLPIITSL